VNTAALRTLVVYAVILPLAIFIGWVTVDLANWDRSSFAMFAAIAFVLLLPVLIKWHYPVMVFSWTTYITIFFMPGQPTLWMLMAGITFAMAILNRIMQRRQAFIPAPSVAATLLVFLAIVLITGKLRGGFGVSALGGATYGGKSYYYITAAILGYFAFTSQAIPPAHARLYVGLYFLSGLISAFSNLIYFAGPSFYFLFLLFPVSFAAVQAVSEYSGPISRMAGFGTAACAAGFYMLAVHNIRGVLARWWRPLLLILVLAIGSLSGYRTNMLLFGFVFVALFCVEGLLRSPIFPGLLLACLLGFALISTFSLKLPLSMQRSLSFLPITTDTTVRFDAATSVQWRLDMWRVVVADVPKYLWLGKGYAISPTDLYLTQQAVIRNRAPGFAGAILAGDYHSGPLSVCVPFGVFGSATFLAFLAVSLRALYLNYRYGSEELRKLNRFLFAYFLGRVFFFFLAFGALSLDLYHFTGTVGLSIALNRGICRKPAMVSTPVRIRGNLELGATQPGTA
jgi:hypothetical protein